MGRLGRTSGFGFGFGVSNEVQSLGGFIHLLAALEQSLGTRWLLIVPT